MKTQQGDLKMSAITSTPIKAGADKSTPSGRLFFLDIGGGRVLSANPDGSDLKTIINEGRKFPDGLVVDAAAGHIYWTNMGNFKKNDGSIFRSDLDGDQIFAIEIRTEDGAIILFKIAHVGPVDVPGSGVDHQSVREFSALVDDGLQIGTVRVCGQHTAGSDI